MNLRWTVLGLGLLAAGCVGPDVRGKVVDGNGEPIAGAVVQSEGDRAMTDGDGFFALQNIGWGEYHNVTVTAPGYQTRHQTVMAPKNFKSEVIIQDFVLEPDPRSAQGLRGGATTQPAGMPRRSPELQQQQSQQQQPPPEAGSGDDVIIEQPWPEGQQRQPQPQQPPQSQPTPR